MSQIRVMTDEQWNDFAVRKPRIATFILNGSSFTDASGDRWLPPLSVSRQALAFFPELAKEVPAAVRSEVQSAPVAPSPVVVRVRTPEQAEQDDVANEIDSWLADVPPAPVVRTARRDELGDLFADIESAVGSDE